MLQLPNTQQHAYSRSAAAGQTQASSKPPQLPKTHLLFDGFLLEAQPFCFGVRNRFGLLFQFHCAVWGNKAWHAGANQHRTLVEAMNDQRSGALALSEARLDNNMRQRAINVVQ